MPTLDPLLDPGDDFLQFDFEEVVTYRVRGLQESFTDVPNVTALYRQGMDDEPDFAGKEVTIYHVLASELPGPAKPRDRIKRMNGEEWEIVDANKQTFDTRFRLHCVKCR